MDTEHDKGAANMEAYAVYTTATTACRTFVGCKHTRYTHVATVADAGHADRIAAVYHGIVDQPGRTEHWTDPRHVGFEVWPGATADCARWMEHGFPPFVRSRVDTGTAA